MSTGRRPGVTAPIWLAADATGFPVCIAPRRLRPLVVAVVSPALPSRLVSRGHRVGRGEGGGALACSRRRRMALGHRGLPHAALSRPVDVAQSAVASPISIKTTAGSEIKHLSLGPVRVAARGPSVLRPDTSDVVQIATNPIGFDGATESDRLRWLNAFRRLLDGLDAPLQVLIESEPGCGVDTTAVPPQPRDFDDMRCTDLWFVDQLAHSPSAHRRVTSVVTAKGHSPRLETALRESGVGFVTSV